MPGSDPILSPVERGRMGGRKRWGPQRVVRLDALDPRVAAAVRALVAADSAARKETPTVSETPAGVDGGGDRGADSAA